MKSVLKTRASIVGKLAGILSLMIVLTLLVATVTLAVREYRDLQAKLDNKLVLTADMIGQNSSVALLFDDQKTTQEVLAALGHDAEITEGIIESVSGQTFAVYSKPAQQWQSFWPDNLPRTRQVSRMIYHNGDQLVGRISMTADLSQTYNSLFHNALINGGIVWIALCLAGLFVLRLQYGFLKPILQLADTARQIEKDHDYRKRAVYEGNDEIRVLAEAFNNMLAEIQRKESYLEDQVQQRTQALELAMRNAEAANQAKSQFLANMSHEIRTPMNAIFGLVELCLNQPLDNKPRAYLQRVETASRALMSIIDDILDFSKIEAGKMLLEAIPFDIMEMMEAVYATMRESAVSKGIQLLLECQNFNYTVIGDPYRLRQVLLNLIGNAIKFTEQGEVKVCCRESSRQPAQVCLEFSILDTGIGMTQDQQTKLFQPFSQGDSSVTRNYGGTGLGLVISKQLIEQMAGNICVSSQEHIGSVFTFTVKLDLADSLVLSPADPAQLVESSSDRLMKIRNARVLLVEDNEINRLVATELLTQAGLQVDVAENGARALEKLLHQNYACVLMDVQMPVMDGYQTTRLLRNMPGSRELPVIAMTASAMPADRESCLAAGMNDFISKPILPDKLYKILLKWVKPPSA